MTRNSRLASDPHADEKCLSGVGSSFQRFIAWELMKGHIQERQVLKILV